VAFWVVALVTLGLDQGVKVAVRARLVEGDTLPLLSGLLNLTYVRNTGAAFGLFPGYQPIFIATSCVVLIVIAAYWRRSRPTAWPLVIALGLITGGAVGNLIDRAIIGRVTDMFEFGMIDFPVFNIADTAILLGVAILVLWLLFVPEAPPADVELGECAEDPQPSSLAGVDADSGANADADEGGSS